MNKKGFTLIEALASITIIAILALVATSSYQGVLKRNRIRECQQAKSYFEQKIIENVYELGKSRESDFYKLKDIGLDNYISDMNSSYKTDWFSKMKSSSVLVEYSAIGAYNATIDYNCEG